MKPKEFIRITQWIDKHNLAICDGMSEPMSLQSILYPLFVMSGLVFFLTISIKWESIKNKFRK